MIGDNVTIKNSVVMGADYTEDPSAAADGQVHVGIGSNSTIIGAILDKNSRIGTGVSITNEQGVETMVRMNRCKFATEFPS